MHYLRNTRVCARVLYREGRGFRCQNSCWDTAYPTSYCRLYFTITAYHPCYSTKYPHFCLTGLTLLVTPIITSDDLSCYLLLPCRESHKRQFWLISFFLSFKLFYDFTIIFFKCDSINYL